MIDKKTFTVGVLSVAALVLFVANLMMPQPAIAEVAVKDRDYTAVTGRTTRGGHALFLTDNRTGVMAVFLFDPSSRSVRLLDAKPLTDAFAGRAEPENRNDRPGNRAGNRGGANRAGNER